MNRLKTALLGIGDSMVVVSNDRLHYFKFNPQGETWSVLVATDPVAVTPLIPDTAEAKLSVVVVKYGQEFDFGPDCCV